MARAAHPDAMKPTRPGGTRTAPPEMPPQFPFSGRYAAYTLFDITGILYLLVGLVVLRAVWALGSGEAAWREVLSQFANPLYVAFHVLTLISVVFVGVRFFRLFPKAQPPRIGPVKPPPQPAIMGLLYVVWIGVAGAMAAILAGGIF
jgi:fumarate reductase subunit C